MTPCHFIRIPYRNRPADWGCSCGWVLDMSTPILDVFEVYAQHVLDTYKRSQPMWSFDNYVPDLDIDPVLEKEDEE